MKLSEKGKDIIEVFIFNMKWILLAFLIKLGWDLMVLAYFVYSQPELTQAQLMHFIEDVDITMIAILIKMMIAGGYNSSISKKHDFDSENISSGQLKIKMGTSIIGISSVHMLKVFMESENLTVEEIWKKTIVHCAFIVGGLALSLIDYLHCKTESHETIPTSGSLPHVNNMGMSGEHSFPQIQESKGLHGEK